MTPLGRRRFQWIIFIGFVTEAVLLLALLATQSSAGPENAQLLLLTLLQLPGSALGAAVVAMPWGEGNPTQARWVYSIVVLVTQCVAIAGVAWIAGEATRSDA